VAEAGGTPARVKEAIGPEALRRLASGDEVSGTVGDRVFGAVTVRSQPDSVHVLLLVANVAGEARQAVRTIALAGAAALLLAGIAAFATARRISRPLSAATSAYRSIASGDLTVRVATSAGAARRNDEIGELMRSLDVMAEALHRAQQQEQQFLLSVSHDLRTPLTSIRGFAEAISEGTAPDQQRAASVIASEARRLERLVGDLLELGKLQAKQFVLAPRPVDLTDLVTDAADGFLPAADRLGLVLGLDAEEGLVAEADPDRLAQMLANLIENALKFARSGVVVAVGREGSNIGRISVSDDGPGIAPDDVAYVFDRHYTSDRRPTRVIGSGLGLAIVRELTDAMGASIVIDTSPQGTAFVLRLPIREA
jgi:two-component system, OmpR family, sensor kinase